jgi:NADH-ubiquinone oxidoreductase chain 5
MYTKVEVIFILGLVILAAITKSAQIPFSAWLPAAIAAPTPVSALVHSSTLVTAGVYLLIRFNYIIGVRGFLFFVGVITMFISGLGANFENDLKKIIALSTLRQLGLIIITLGMGAYELSFFHLLTHAIFKSLLFLCAGVFIHSIGDTQDVRIIGGLFISCPVTSFYFIGSSFALCGFPFLSGFYSKDLILEYYSIRFLNLFMYGVIFLSTLFTLTYSTRLIYYVFFNNLGAKSILNLGETYLILTPMRVLITFSVFAGCFIRIFIFPAIMIFMPTLMKLSILLSLLFIFSYLINYMNLKLIKMLMFTNKIKYYFGSMWFLPFLTTILWFPLTKFGSLITKSTDQGWMEYLGGQGFSEKRKTWGVSLDSFNVLNIKVYIYAFILVFLVILIGFINYLNSLRLKHRIEAARIVFSFLNGVTIKIIQFNYTLKICCFT